MQHRIFRKEGPGGLVPEDESIIPYAKSPEELRLLNDVEQRAQNAERRAKDEAAGAIALAKGDAIDASIETDEEARLRSDEIDRIEAARAAVLDASDKAETGTLRFMDESEIERSRPLERRLSGEIIPDEVIEMKTPHWIDPNDPEFAMPDTGPKLMTDVEANASVIRERELAERSSTVTQYIELGGEETPIPDLTQTDTPFPRKENEGERERMERVLGPDAKAPVRFARTPEPEKGFLMRIKRWFA